MKKSAKLVFLEKILRFMAKTILWKYQPTVIGITGSIGKTSTKEAVFTVISGKFRTRQNAKNYNNEIGLPLTVIGAESGGKSFLRWTWVFLKWIFLIIFPFRYPEVLVLEMGADRPGDIHYLSSFIHPKIGIITDISGSHLEFFKDLDGVTKEKGALVRELPEDGIAILNTDNERIQKLAYSLERRIISFGFGEKVDMRSEGVAYNYDDDSRVQGLSFKLNYKGTNLPVRLKNVLAKHQIYAALAAAAAGVSLGMNLVDVAQALQKFCPPVGRMNLITGIRGTFIIDDTYNASPASVLAALNTLGEIKSERKIAILGDMLELGGDTEAGHRRVAQKFLEIGGYFFIGVGSRMKFAIDELKKRSFPLNRMVHFEDPIEASVYVSKILRPADLVLVKGSQGARMEKISEALLRHPEKASELLCRQDKYWKEISVGKI